MTIRAMVIDDEPLAREKLIRHLAIHPDIEVVGECGDGTAAVAAILDRQPDLVFLDVQLPECDAFEVLRRIGGKLAPAVIFVTAYDRYALQAFEIHALDYLVKPFDEERLASALAHAREQVLQARQARLHGVAPRPSGLTDRILVQSGGRIRILRIGEIDWIEAAANYVKIHAGREAFLYRQTMSNMEAWLDPRKFARIHRSSIVNIDRIKELEPLFKGAYTVILQDETQLTLSPMYRGRLSL
jgi:two-component system LytT family response regulator